MKKTDVKPQQKYSLKIKKGAVLYKLSVWTDDCTGRAKTEMETWIVRSIKKIPGSQSKHGFKTAFSNEDYFNGKHVYLTEKRKGETWGKLSRKQFDYGWFSSISHYYKINFKEGEPIPLGIYTTKLAACQFAVSTAGVRVCWYFNALKNKTMSDKVKQDYVDEQLEAERELKACKTYLKSFKTKLRVSNSCGKEKM